MFPTSIAYKNEYYLDSAYPLCYTTRIIRKWAYSDMAGVWDSSMKRLVGINPQAFVTWLLGDAQEDKTWLLRRFRMFQDIIRDTEIYQYIMHEGLEQGIEQGREQGREQERQEALQRELQRQRQALIAFVQARSTELVPFATAQAEQINNIDVLNKLTLNVGLAQNLEEVRHYLQEASSKEKY